MAGRLRICLIILGLLLNANSNLRAPIGQAFGFDPFERVVDYLTDQIERGACKGR